MQTATAAAAAIFNIFLRGAQIYFGMGKHAINTLYKFYVYGQLVSTKKGCFSVLTTSLYILCCLSKRVSIGAAPKSSMRGNCFQTFPPYSSWRVCGLLFFE